MRTLEEEEEEGVVRILEQFLLENILELVLLLVLGFVEEEVESCWRCPEVLH